MSLLEDLTAADPTTRVLAVQHVRQTDLDDLSILDALLINCRDTTPLPDSMQPPVPDDPFADFFGQEKKTPKRAVIADTACERLVFTGVIGKPETLPHLVQALQADDCGVPLCKAMAKVLGQTQWVDRLAAATALVPVLHQKDVALYEVVVRFGEAEHAVMIHSALHPYNSRAVNELLNHQGSKPAMEQALDDAVAAGQITKEADAADVLTLMVAWDSSHAGSIAAALEPYVPWALLVLAIDDAEAAARLGPWLDAEHPAPIGLVRKVQEALKTRDDLPHFPIARWLRYTGTGVDVVRQWGAAVRCRPQLEAFVADWDAAPERAWEAVAALVEAGIHAQIQPQILAGLEREQESALWTPSIVGVLARAQPKIPDLLKAMESVIERHPLRTRAVVPALLEGYAPEDLREIATAYIALCETRPVVRKPSQPTLIHEEREGVDPVPLQPLVNALGDPALIERLENVLPYVRAVES